MFYYAIGWHSYEEGVQKTFTHKQYFTHESLEEIVEEALMSVLERSALYTKEALCGNDKEGDGDDGDLLITSCIKFSDLINRFFIEELEKKGFQLVTYDGGCSVFGWAHICHDDWKESDRLGLISGPGLTDRIRDRIPQAFKDHIHKLAEYLRRR